MIMEPLHFCSSNMRYRFKFKYIIARVFNDLDMLHRVSSSRFILLVIISSIFSHEGSCRQKSTYGSKSYDYYDKVPPRQTNQDWSIELTSEPPVLPSPDQLDVRLLSDQSKSFSSHKNVTNIGDPLPINKWQKQTEVALDRYLAKIHQFDLAQKNDYRSNIKSQNFDQYLVNSSQKIIDNLNKLKMYPYGKLNRELPVFFGARYVPGSMPYQGHSLNSGHDEISRLTSQQNKESLSQKYMTESTLPTRASHNELIWYADQGMVPMNIEPYNPRLPTPYTTFEIIPGSKLFGSKHKPDIRSWEEITRNSASIRLQNRLGDFIKSKSSRLDGDIAINLNTPEESTRYHIIDDNHVDNYVGESSYRPPSMKYYKREDDSGLLMQPSHYAHHYELPHSMSPMFFNKGPTKKSGLEKAGYSVLIGSIAALISFLIISNIFLSIPLFAMTVMQLLQPNNQIIPMNMTPNNQQITPTNQNGQLVNGKRRKKRELTHPSNLTDQISRNYDNLTESLMKIIDFHEK